MNTSPKGITKEGFFFTAPEYLPIPRLKRRKREAVPEYPGHQKSGYSWKANGAPLKIPIHDLGPQQYVLERQMFRLKPPGEREGPATIESTKWKMYEYVVKDTDGGECDEWMFCHIIKEEGADGEADVGWRRKGEEEGGAERGWADGASPFSREGGKKKRVRGKGMERGLGWKKTWRDDRKEGGGEEGGSERPLEVLEGLAGKEGGGEGGTENGDAIQEERWGKRLPTATLTREEEGGGSGLPVALAVAPALTAGSRLMEGTSGDGVGAGEGQGGRGTAGEAALEGFHVVGAPAGTAGSVVTAGRQTGGGAQDGRQVAEGKAASGWRLGEVRQAIEAAGGGGIGRGSSQGL